MSSPPPSWTTPESRRGRASRRDSHARPLDGDSSEDERLARLDLASSAPLAAARRGARDPLVRRASAHAFLRGRELFRASLPAMRARPGVRDFVADASFVPGRGLRERPRAHGRGLAPLRRSFLPRAARVRRDPRRRGRGAPSARVEIGDKGGVLTRTTGAARPPPRSVAPRTTGASWREVVRGDSSQITASGDQTVRLWDVETGGAPNLRGHRGSHMHSPCRDPPRGCRRDVFASCGRADALALWDRRDRGRRRVRRRPLGDAKGVGPAWVRRARRRGPVSGPISVVERAHAPLARVSAGVSSARRVNTRGAAAARRRAAEADALRPERSPLRVRRRPRRAACGRCARPWAGRGASSLLPAGWGSSSSLASRERGAHVGCVFARRARVGVCGRGGRRGEALGRAHARAGCGRAAREPRGPRAPVERGGVPGDRDPSRARGDGAGARASRVRA